MLLDGLMSRLEVILFTEGLPQINLSSLHTIRMTFSRTSSCVVLKMLPGHFPYQKPHRCVHNLDLNYSPKASLNSSMQSWSQTFRPSVARCVLWCNATPHPSIHKVTTRPLQCSCTTINPRSRACTLLSNSSRPNASMVRSKLATAAWYRSKSPRVMFGPHSAAANYS
jgi:hypothetical protein